MKRVFWLVVLVLGALAVAGAPASAQSSGEHITSYDVTMTIQPNGLLDVREVIGYDFGVIPRHGIFRDIPDRENNYDAHHDRVYKITNVRVGASAGTPSEATTSHQGPYLHIRIGDPNTTITGLHTYRIDYTVQGALRTFPDHQELAWDAIGLQWPVPIDRATAVVNAPANITRVACYTGPQGSTLSCDRATYQGEKAAFAQRLLGPEEGMTVVVGLPPHTITPDPQPILERRHTLADAFSVRPDTAIPGGLLALLGIAAVSIFAWRRGRDRQYVGSPTDVAFGTETGEAERVGIGGMETGPVEFVPPDKVRPGQVGTLVDEHANLVDVTSTIIDLAVRGWLTITEKGKKDYTLTATTKAGKGTLLPYETAVMDALFKGRTSVDLSDLKYKWRPQLAKIQNALYDDMVAEGWYHTRPDRTRLTWAGFGLLMTIIAVGVTVLVAWKTSYGLVAIALVLIGVALLAAAGHMPARTPKGSAMLSRIKGFRRLFDEGDEDIRARFAEDHDIFSQYLPYAIVFGCAKRWARAFEPLGAEAMGTTDWYHGTGMLNAIILADAMDDFGTVATGTMYASQPSSSSSSGFGGGGFSGGGGGGGGGGSW